MIKEIYLGVGGRPLTLAKAKRDNIKHQRLPLERYLKYKKIHSKQKQFCFVYNLDLVVMLVEHYH